MVKVIFNDYPDPVERLSFLIGELAVLPGNIKQRLPVALLQYWDLDETNFPEHLRYLFKEIDKIVRSKPADEYNNVFYNSLYGKRMKTCSDIAKKIIELHSRVKWDRAHPSDD